MANTAVCRTAIHRFESGSRLKLLVFCDVIFMHLLQTTGIVRIVMTERLNPIERGIKKLSAAEMVFAGVSLLLLPLVGTTTALTIGLLGGVKYAYLEGKENKKK